MSNEEGRQYAKKEESGNTEENITGNGGAGEKMPAEESDPAVLRELLAEQTTRAEDNYERLIRLHADYENYRRRTRQETENLYKYASEQLVCALLPVLDNFERALSAGGDSVADFKSGVEMIFRQFKEVLAAEGVKEIPSRGEQFDPEKHEAVLRVDSDEHEDNTVIEEMRRGYFLKDKVIRPSMVKVAISTKKQEVN